MSRAGGSLETLTLEWDVRMTSTSGFLPEPEEVQVNLAYLASQQTGHQIRPEWIQPTVVWDRARQHWVAAAKRTLRVPVIRFDTAAFVAAREWPATEPLLWDGDQA